MPMGHLHLNTGILHGDTVNDRGDIVRLIRNADPIDAVSGAAIMDDGFPLQESRGGRLHWRIGGSVRSEPRRPFFSGIFRVAGAYIKFQTWCFAMFRRFC